MGFIDHRKLYFRHFQQQEDGEFIEASSDQVHLASHQFGQLDEDIFLHAEFPFHPKAASTGDVLEIQLVINQDSYYLYLPVRIAGKATPPAQVPVLGSTVSPKIPYMVLHDPPGDASFSSFESGKSFCRSTSLTLGNGTDFSANAAVKLGIAGSAGFIVTTDFEFSTTLSTGLTLSTTQTSENTYETCLEVTESFETSSLENVGDGFRDGDDLFIGYGTELIYGAIIDSLVYEDCQLVPVKKLIIAPSGKKQQFILTERGINKEIDQLRRLIAQTTDNKTAIQSQNQIDVWEQVIQLNRENKTDESDFLRSIRFFGGSAFSMSEELTTKVTKSIETELFLETRVGVEFLAEAGGSGVSGGFELNTNHNLGVSSQTDAENRKLITYQLLDDDFEDQFIIDVYRDPMFGTPYFKLMPGSKTSCPFEGGQQIDAPKLYNGADCSNKSKYIDIVNVPIETSVTAPIEICNESDQRRFYSIRLDGQTNPLGAIIDLNGRNLNNHFEGQAFELEPNACLKALLIIRNGRPTTTLNNSDTPNNNSVTHSSNKPSSANRLSACKISSA